MVEEVRKALPELPTAKRQRFIDTYGLTDYDAGVLTAEKEVAQFFEESVQAQVVMTGLGGRELGKETSNWVMVELAALLKSGKAAGEDGRETKALEITKSPVSPRALGELLGMKRKGEISGPIAKSVLEEMFQTGRSPADIIKAKGLVQISDEAALDKIIQEVIDKNPAQLAQYRSGKEAVFGFFVGQVMKASGGKANPAKVNELLKAKLKP